MKAEQLSAKTLAEALDRDIQTKLLGYGEEAATRFLAAHGYWLDVQALRPHIELTGGCRSGLRARIVWATACHIPNSARSPNTEDDVLRFACHLAGCIPSHLDDSWSLAEIIAWFDVSTTLLANRAFAMATLGPQAVKTLD